MAKNIIKDIEDVDMSVVATKRDLLTMTSNLVAAYLGNHQIEHEDVPSVIDRVYQKLTSLNGSSPPLAPSALPTSKDNAIGLRPAVEISQSIQPDFIVCLEDGVKLKMLKRHLRTAYKLTPEQYRAKWNLPSDYPMVAPNYAVLRSSHAKKIGLGRKAKDSNLLGIDSDF